MAEVISDLVVKIGADISGMQQGFATAEERLQTFGSTATAAGTSLVKLGAPLTAVGLLAASTAGDFESSMNIMSTAVSGSGTSLESLRQVAILAGADVNLVGVSAGDVAGAMTNFAKAGVPVNNMLGDMEGYLAGSAEMGGQLRAAIDLAAASELDLEAASRLVITTMATFGLEAGEASAAMDIYVRAADASVMSVEDIRDAMENVGPTMAQFGFSVTDSATALALLSTRGIAGAEAGTALKSMMVNLMRPTEGVTSTLAAMNVSLYDAAGNMKPLPTIMADLERGMVGMTEEQRNNTIVTLAGSYGMKAMSTLLSEGTTGWNDMSTAIGSAATMQATADARTKGFNASMEQLRSTIETFLINVGTPLIRDVLTPMIQRFTEIVGGLADMDPRWAGLAIVVGGVVTVLGTVLIIVGQMAAGLAALAPIVGAVGAPFLAIAAAVALFATAWTNDWGGIQTTLTTVWNEQLKPIFDRLVDWFEVAIPAAIAILVGFWTNTLLPALEAVFKFIAETLIPIFVDIVTWLADNIPPAITTLAGFWNDTLLPAIRAVWTFINDTLLPIFSTIVTWLATTIAGAISTLAGFWNDTLLPAIRAVWTFINDTLLPIFSTIVTWLATTIAGAISTLAGYWNDTLLPAIRAVWTFIDTYLVPIFNGVAGVMNAALTLAINALTGLWQNVLLPALKAVYNFINDTLSGIFGSLASTLGGSITTAVNDLSGLWNNTLLPALRAVYNFINDTLGGIFGGLASTLNGSITTATNNLAGLWNNTLAPALHGVRNYIAEHLQPGFDTLASNFSTGIGAAVTSLTDLWLGSSGSGGLLGALQDIWGFIKYSVLGVFADLTEAVGVNLSDPLTIIKDLWEKLEESLGNIPQILTDIATWFGTLKTKIKNLTLPDWLTPGSPTPLETALRGILSALEAVAGGPWQWFTDFVKFVTGGGGGSGSGPVTNFTITVAAGAVVVYGTGGPGLGDEIGLGIARALKALIDAETTAGAAASGTYPPPWQF